MKKKYRVPSDFRQMMEEAIDEQQKDLSINGPHSVLSADDGGSPLSEAEQLIKARLIIKDLLSFLPFFWRHHFHNGLLQLSVMPIAVDNALVFLDEK